MDKIQWIKDLVSAEQQMEEAGVVDMTPGFDAEQSLVADTVDYLKDLKCAFIEAASAFNQLKGSTIGNLKIYGISKTKADFMLFRNGFKLIFTMKRPGEVHIFFNQMGTSLVPGAPSLDEGSEQKKAVLKARWKAFGELNWTYDEQPIRIDYLVRYYMSQFVRESAK